MKFLLSTSTLALLIASMAAFAAEDYVCSNNGDKRIVSIIYQNEGAPVPCEVQYDKGQGVQILWTAQSEEGFCEARVDEFLQRQESWGWSCSKFEMPDVSENEMVDTDAQKVSVHESTESSQQELHTSMH